MTANPQPAQTLPPAMVSGAPDTPVPDQSPGKGEKGLPGSVFDPIKPGFSPRKGSVEPQGQKAPGWTPRGQRLLDIVARDNPARLKLFQRVLAGNQGGERPANKSACIKMFCLLCMGMDSIGVKECADRCCPLWRHRPFQRKADQ